MGCGCGKKKKGTTSYKNSKIIKKNQNTNTNNTKNGGTGGSK